MSRVDPRVSRVDPRVSRVDLCLRRSGPSSHVDQLLEQTSSLRAFEFSPRLCPLVPRYWPSSVRVTQQEARHAGVHPRAWEQAVAGAGGQADEPCDVMSRKAQKFAKSVEKIMMEDEKARRYLRRRGSRRRPTRSASAWRGARPTAGARRHPIRFVRRRGARCPRRAPLDSKLPRLASSGSISCCSSSCCSSSRSCSSSSRTTRTSSERKAPRPFR